MTTIRLRELANKEGVTTFDELQELTVIGKRFGFGDNATRFNAYKKILFSQRSSQISSIIQKVKCHKGFDRVKEGDVIDKDAARSQFHYFDGKELVRLC